MKNHEEFNRRDLEKVFARSVQPKGSRLVGVIPLRFALSAVK